MKTLDEVIAALEDVKAKHGGDILVINEKGESIDADMEVDFVDEFDGAKAVIFETNTNDFN